MVDICLLLEGTWPYVSGGVATWVDQLIRGLPHLRFGVVHIGANPDQTQELKYQLPPQVEWIENIHLHGPVLPLENQQIDLEPSQIRLNLAMTSWEDPLWIERLSFLFPSDRVWPPLEKAFYSKETWDFILALYENLAPDQSFLDFLWTWRFTSLPLWRLCRYHIPEAKVYHTISTGYAGFLGVLASLRHQRPLMLTEHGIYTREREIEIQSSEWIYGINDEYATHERRDFFRKWWIDLFHFLNRICYQHANGIYTLFEANRLTQIRMGAKSEICQVIPNGVIPERFQAARERFFAKKNTSPTILFAGRIVPIKDIKTLLRSFALVLKELPDAKLLLLGPADEDPDYAADCQKLAQNLQINHSVEWAGMVRLEDHLDRGDVMVLSSLSEAQPLVLLEGACVGMPSVATQVGSCQELLEGNQPEDCALGVSGLIVPVGNPQRLASALLTLLKDKSLAIRMGEAGFARVQKYYRQDDLMARYHSKYHQMMQVRPWQV